MTENFCKHTLGRKQETTEKIGAVEKRRFSDDATLAKCASLRKIGPKWSARFSEAVDLYARFMPS